MNWIYPISFLGTTFEINDIFLNLTLPLLGIFIAIIALIITFYWKISGVNETLAKIETHTESMPTLSLKIERLLTMAETHRSVNVKLGDIDLKISALDRGENNTQISFFFSENVVNSKMMIALLNKEKWNVEFEKKYGDTGVMEISEREWILLVSTKDNDILSDYLKNIVIWLEKTYIPEAKKWKKEFDEKLSDVLK